MDIGDASAADRSGLAWRSPSHAGSASNGAAARAEAARVRVAELRRRRHDLAAGFGATAQTVATARQRAAEALRRAQQAHQAAAHAAARRPI